MLTQAKKLRVKNFYFTPQYNGMQCQYIINCAYQSHSGMVRVYLCAGDVADAATRQR